MLQGYIFGWVLGFHFGVDVWFPFWVGLLGFHVCGAWFPFWGVLGFHVCGAWVLCLLCVGMRFGMQF